MQRNILRGIAGAGALLAVTWSPALLAAQPGPYLGGGVGLYTLDVDDIDYDDSAALFRGFGGWRLNDNWAIEADYQRFTESEDDFLGTDVELDFEGYGVALRPIIPVGDLLDIYGKVGWTWYDGEVNLSCSGDACPAVATSVTGSDDDFTWGGGVDFHLGDLLTLRGEISRIEIEDTDLNLISAALLLRF